MKFLYFDENVFESKDKEYIIINIEYDLVFLKCKIIEKINFSLEFIYIVFVLIEFVDILLNLEN